MFLENIQFEKQTKFSRLRKQESTYIAEFENKFFYIVVPYYVERFIVNMILLLIFLILCSWIVHFRYRRRNMYKLAALIKNPNENWPIIGIAHKLAGNTEGKL